MFAIKSNRTILPEGIKKAAVIINGGLIEAVLDELPHHFPGEIIDAGDAILMAGVIDPHVHINEPGRTDWEGFDTAGKAALTGGITTLVDMPLNSSPVTTTIANFAAKIKATDQQLHTNIGFWGGLVPGNDTEIEGLAKSGILGFKAFLTHSGIDEFPNVTEDDLRKAMPIIARLNLPLLVHCELTDDELRATGDVSSYQNYLLSRPKQWENNAVAMMIQLCREFNCHVHIVHLSSAESIDQIVTARAEGLPITVETGQHYLYFCAETIGDGQTQFKCAPPIREQANNDQLWSALKNGTIDFVATDHSPAPPDMKQIDSGNFMSAWGGIASIQFALPVLWTAAKQRDIPVQRMAEWLCEKPAQLIGKEKSKGKIAEGFDADLIVWNDNESFTVTEEQIQHRHKITPYLQEKLYGVIEQTYIAGLKVFGDGHLLRLNAGKIIGHKSE